MARQIKSSHSAFCAAPPSRKSLFLRKEVLYMDYTESVKNTMEYIDAHLADELSAEKIAANEGYSVFHFCRIFKEYTGKSLMRYVREKRLETAEQDIENGEPASCVAVKYGFETSSGFARAYEKKFGRRPTKRMHA